MKKGKLLKPSRYNYYIKCNCDYLLCNLYAGVKSFLKVKINDFSKIRNILNADLVQFDEDNTVHMQLFDAGYLIDLEEDELLKVHMAYNELAFNNTLNLIIMPTEQCNFRCKYCYEEYQMGEMHPKVQESIVRFIQKYSHRYNAVSIQWFGGEPLLSKSIIKNISQMVNFICSKRKTPITYGVTTNGYDLSPNNFKELYELGIYNFQITLDGCKSEHDSQRVLISGEGSYDRIVENLIYIKEHNDLFPKANITIRVNVSKSILKKFDNFLRFYEKTFSGDKRFSVLFKIAGELSSKDLGDFRSEIINNNITDIHSILQFHNIFSNTNIDLNNAFDVFTPMSNICYASMKNSFVVRPDGTLYKCTVHFTEIENSVGKIDIEGNLQLNEYLNAKWTIKHDFREKCHSCVFLPICGGGGCTYYTNIKKCNDCCLSLDLKNNIGNYLSYISNFVNIPYIKLV